MDTNRDGTSWTPAERHIQLLEQARTQIEVEIDRLEKASARITAKIVQLQLTPEEADAFARVARDRR